MWKVLAVQGQATSSFHNFIQYNTSNGLSSYNVKKIIQDSRGFTWIATQDGLNLFDGYSFRIFRNNGQYWRRIADNAVMDIAYHPSQPYVWLCLPYKGIQTINTQNYTVITVLGGERLNQVFSSDLLTTISITPDAAQLWIGAAGSFAVVRSGDSKLLYSSKSASLNTGYVKKIIHDGNDHTYVVNRDGTIFIFQTRSLQLLQTIAPAEWNPALPTQVNDAIALDNGQLLLATDLGLMTIQSHSNRWSTGQSQLSKLANELQLRYIKSVYKDARENVWIASEAGLHRFEGSRFVSIKPIIDGSNSWLTSIADIYVDKADNLWIGCKHGLVQSTVNQSAFQPYMISNHENGEPGHVFNIYPETGHTLLVSTDAGIYRVDLENKSLKLIGDPTTPGAAFRGPGNTTIVSCGNKLFLLNKEQNDRLITAETLFPELAVVKNDVITENLPVGDSVLLLGSDQENGLYLWNYRQKKVDHFTAGSKNNSLGDNTVNFIRLMPGGKTALIGGDKNLTVLNLNNYSTTTTRLFSAETDSVNYYFDCYANAGKYYFACYQYGVIETDENFNITRKLTESDGLTNNGVYRLEPDPDSGLWISSNNGLSRLNLATGSVKGYYKYNGLHGNNFEEFSSARLGNKIFMGGLEGITQITPWQHNKENLSIPLYFLSYTLTRQNRTTDSLASNGAVITIPPQVSQSTIHFSAIDYYQPQQLKFEYRLNGGDSDWVALGNQHFISLIGLSPGKHQVSIRASADNRNWSSPQYLVLNVLPKWYQTWLFKAAVALLVSLIAYGAYTYRIRSIHAQQQIRKDIAHDLHDDLGSTLTSMKILAHLSKEDPGHLKQLESTLTDATLGLRDMIWVLDESGDRLSDLVVRIKKTTLPTLTAMSIDLKIQIQHGLEHLQLTKLEKKNILLILKEAINNSVKYSECSAIQINFRYVTGKLQIEIADNGKGFPVASFIKTGNGLTNIKERAQQIKLTAHFRSEPGAGTTIVLF